MSPNEKKMVSEILLYEVLILDITDFINIYLDIVYTNKLFSRRWIFLSQLGRKS